MIADDHPVYRDGLAALLGSLEGFEVSTSCPAEGGTPVEALLPLGTLPRPTG